jgi:DNA-binding transcriptional LysR family regulator
VQSFIAVAEEGSLTGAARRLGQSQPTIGRHIAKAEEVLKMPLFIRARRGLRLSDGGAAILPAARDMAMAAARLSLAAAGRAQTLQGTVRISASIVMAHYVLPEILAGIHRLEPEIEIELHASDASDNLLFHEADIAVRMYRPEQLDIITKHLGDMQIGLYAAKSYLKRRGTPRSQEDLMEHDWVGYDKNEIIIKSMRQLGLQVDRNFFRTRCDDQAAYWRLLEAGCGLGAGQVYVAQRYPRVQRILTDFLIPSIPVWLTAPEALRQSPRIRRVYDLLSEGLTAATELASRQLPSQASAQ